MTYFLLFLIVILAAIAFFATRRAEYFARKVESAEQDMAAVLKNIQLWQDTANRHWKNAEHAKTQLRLDYNQAINHAIDIFGVIGTETTSEGILLIAKHEADRLRRIRAMATAVTFPPILDTEAREHG